MTTGINRLKPDSLPFTDAPLLVNDRSSISEKTAAVSNLQWPESPLWNKLQPENESHQGAKDVAFVLHPAASFPSNTESAFALPYQNKQFERSAPTTWMHDGMVTNEALPIVARNERLDWNTIIPKTPEFLASYPDSTTGNTNGASSHPFTQGEHYSASSGEGLASVNRQFSSPSFHADITRFSEVTKPETTPAIASTSTPAAYLPAAKSSDGVNLHTNQYQSIAAIQKSAPELASDMRLMSEEFLKPSLLPDHQNHVSVTEPDTLPAMSNADNNLSANNIFETSFLHLPGYLHAAPTTAGIWSENKLPTYENGIQAVNSNLPSDHSLMPGGMSQRAALKRDHQNQGTNEGTTPTNPNSRSRPVIQFNRPLIEHLTISVQNTENVAGEFRDKVEEVLLDILNSSELIQ